ncbi:MAG: diguanylate cyclase [Syntrophobacterales bacterium]|jgi:diguanylate cyclase (GGDEF)-like protein|nr:diguanylate cyclase [Syntrophobacterales bacterium]
MPSNPQVLVVDDDPACLQILRKFLEKDGYRVTCVPDGPRALAQARTLKPDLIICDWMMPGMDGPQLCRAVKTDAALKDTFFIFLTALEKSYIGKGIAHGADDFITKPIDPVEVSAKVKAGLRLSRIQKALLNQAQRDPLTGVYNRRYWDNILRQAAQGATPFLVAIVDVDGFKGINDRWGHQLGDDFLIELGRIWSENLEEGEVLARLGGDEFVCLFHRPLTRLNLLRQHVEQELSAAFPELPVGLSLGYASFHPRRPATAVTLLSQADRRLYQEKSRRRVHRQRS